PGLPAPAGGDGRKRTDTPRVAEQLGRHSPDGRRELIVRRWTKWMLGSLALLMCAGAMALAPPPGLARLTVLTTNAVVRAVEHRVAANARARGAARARLAHVLDRLTSVARADEVLQFKPVSPESAARAAARARRLRDQARSTPPKPAAPDTLTRLPDEDQTS